MGALANGWNALRRDHRPERARRSPSPTRAPEPFTACSAANSGTTPTAFGAATFSTVQLRPRADLPGRHLWQRSRPRAASNRGSAVSAAVTSGLQFLRQRRLPARAPSRPSATEPTSAIPASVSLRGPGQFNFDFSIVKSTRVGGIHENATLQIPRGVLQRLQPSAVQQSGDCRFDGRHLRRDHQHQRESAPHPVCAKVRVLNWIQPNHKSGVPSGYPALFLPKPSIF